MTTHLRPFDAGDVPAAAQLVARRHRVHRRAAPWLPIQFEDGRQTMALVDATWRWPGAVGVAASENGRLVGFLIGLPGRPDGDGLAGGYVPASGVGLDPDAPPDCIADLYQALAVRWQHLARHEHHVQLPGGDPTLLAAWRDLGFDDFLVLATARLPLPPSRADPRPIDIRQATDDPTDLSHMVDLLRALRRHHATAHIGLAAPAEDDAAEHATQRRLLADPRSGCWLAFHNGAAVGLLTLRPPGAAVSPLHLPPTSIHIVDTVTLPAARGTGVATSLCHAALGWAALLGYRHATLHVHARNEEGARFWDRLGFTPSAHQLVRSGSSG